MTIIPNIVFLFASIIFIYLLIKFIRFLNKVWWTPMYIQYHMRAQGIKGPSYNFLHGSTKEISNMRRNSMCRAMDDLSHDIFPRILPDIYSWVNLYGNTCIVTTFLVTFFFFSFFLSILKWTKFVPITGPSYLNWFGCQSQLVVTEPELVKEILNNKNENYPKINLEGYARKLLGDGLSSSKGEKWGKMRKLANQVFHAESLKSMVPDMITSAEIMVERWKEHDGTEIEVFEEFRLLTSEVISRTAFGSSYLEGKNIFEMLMKLTVLLSRNVHQIRFPGISLFVKSRDEIESEKLEQGIKDCIVQIIKARQKKSEEGESSKGNFLEKLLEANSLTTENQRISVEDIVDECKTFYFAGHETTSSLLGWNILLLAIHKDWQERAREEVIDLFGQNNPNADGITRLRTMNMIIEESLRLYPPVPAIKRITEKKVKLGKMTLPPNMELLISPLALHHDPKIWGNDVHLFKPERFKGGVAKATNNNPAAFLPFGFGPRTCVGLHFAMTEAKIALSMILQRYKFTLSPNYIHFPVQVFMLCPQQGVRIILHKA